MTHRDTHRRRSDQEEEYRSFYGTTPDTFPPSMIVGSRVHGDGLGVAEFKGYGTVERIDADRLTAIVRFDGDDEAMSVCAVDVRIAVEGGQ